MTPLGLYIHIPWCVTRCIYCDFNTYIDGSGALRAAYHAALRQEIAESARALDHPPLSTIFFGGGTPTTLPAEWLAEIVETVRANFALAPEAEITTEANPGTLTVDYLRTLRAGGVNRLSLGVQSFDDRELHLLSRLHDSQSARDAVRMARAAGFENLSLDLIFNLPGQTLAQWQYTLQAAIALDPDHLSVYSLIVEPGTPLQRLVGRGELATPDDDLAAAMYEESMTTLGEAGYSHYEISNWARRGPERDWESAALASAHNLIYWRNQPYLGVGAGAVSTVNGQRWTNVKRPHRYIQCIAEGQGLALAREPRSAETLDDAMALTEQVMLGLRLLREGLSAHTLQQRFGIDLAQRYANAIMQGEARGLLQWIPTPTDPRLRLTRQGRFLANQATLLFFE